MIQNHHHHLIDHDTLRKIIEVLGYPSDVNQREKTLFYFKNSFKIIIGLTYNKCVMLGAVLTAR
jgi:hypothetical protein